MLKEGPTAAEQQSINRHFAYLKELCDRGTVLLAGRTQTDDPSTFGIVILEAESEAEARRMMQNDPGVKEGLMNASIFPFRIALPEADPSSRASLRHQSKL